MFYIGWLIHIKTEVKERQVEVPRGDYFLAESSGTKPPGAELGCEASFVVVDTPGIATSTFIT